MAEVNANSAFTNMGVTWNRSKGLGSMSCRYEVKANTKLLNAETKVPGKQ